MTGLWMTPSTVRAISRTVAPRISWWLSPVIWPDEEEGWKRLVAEALRDGARHFVLNAPWQIALFGRERLREPLHLVAGPFCNASNAACIAVLASMGFEAAFVSPMRLLPAPRENCSGPGATGKTPGYIPAGRWDLTDTGPNWKPPVFPFSPVWMKPRPRVCPKPAVPAFSTGRGRCSRAFCSRKYLPVSPHVPARRFHASAGAYAASELRRHRRKGGVAAERMFRADLQPPTSKG